MAQPKATFRDVAKEYLAQFKDSQCLLTISVGQATHEGELFDLTIDLINKSFSSCIILVDDSLQRHTMALNSSNNADYFYDISIKEGLLWLERNKKYYSKLTIPVKMMHWDKWLKHPSFQDQQAKIKQLIATDPSYRLAFDNSIELFLKKYYERLINQANFNLQRAQQLSYDFLIEECTALCLWVELQCHFEVYPSRRNQAMDETHKRFVLPEHADLLHPVGIRFRNVTQIEPQSFELL